MSHDKIKAAARKRMAETGEPYTLARRRVIAEHQAAQRNAKAEAAGVVGPGLERLAEAARAADIGPQLAAQLAEAARAADIGPQLAAQVAEAARAADIGPQLAAQVAEAAKYYR
jgi:hypothetical protein